MHTSQLYTQNILGKKYDKKVTTARHSHKTKQTIEVTKISTEAKNQLELKYESLKDGTVATSETFDSKLFHNTAPR